MDTTQYVSQAFQHSTRLYKIEHSQLTLTRKVAEYQNYNTY